MMWFGSHRAVGLWLSIKIRPTSAASSSRANNPVTLWIAPDDDCGREIGTTEYASMMEPLRLEESENLPYYPSSTPSFDGANAPNYRAPAEAAALSLGRRVELDAVAVPPGGCVVHAQDCWHDTTDYCSAPNVSAKNHRRVLVAHFVRGDARFIDGHSLQGTGGPTYLHLQQI